MWTSYPELDAAPHHQAWHFIMLSRRGRIINDECQQRRNKTNTIWRRRMLDWDLFSDNVSLFCFSLSPSTFPLPSVVVLYTQGVECKQWREVRDHSRPSVNTTQSACLLSMIAHPLFTSLPSPSSPSSRSQGKCCECQSFAIDWPWEYSHAGQHCVSCDWLRWQLLVSIKICLCVRVPPGCWPLSLN